MHHADAVGDREGLLLVMRHEDRGRAAGLQDLPHLGAKTRAELDVEARERFVHQQEGGARREGARERDALLLAAGQLMRIACALRVPVRRVEHLGDARAALGRAEMAQSEGDVVVHPQVREERVILKHQPDAAFLGRQVGAAVCKVLGAYRDAAARTTSPPISTVPQPTGMKPATARSSVVLPQPELPTTQPISPGRARASARRRPSRHSR